MPQGMDELLNPIGISGITPSVSLNLWLMHLGMDKLLNPIGIFHTISQPKSLAHAPGNGQITQSRRLIKYMYKIFWMSLIGLGVYHYSLTKSVCLSFCGQYPSFTLNPWSFYIQQ